MEIVIKISDEHLAQSGMDEKSLLQTMERHIDRISDAVGNIPITVSMAPRGAMRVPGFILTQWDSFNQTQRYIFSPVEMPQFGHSTVCPYTLEFNLPQGLDEKSSAIEGIRKQQEALEKDFTEKKQALELRMQSLMEKDSMA